MGPSASPSSGRIARLRRLARAGRSHLRREWRRGRLDLTGLPPGTRRLATLALTLIVASGVIVVIDAFGWTVPGPAVEVAGRAIGTTGVPAVPLIAMLVACAGLCAASASFAVSDRLGGRRLSALGLVAVGLLGASLSAGLVNAAQAVGRSASVLPEASAGTFTRAAAIIEPLAMLGVAIGLLTIALAVAPRYRPRPWLLAIASTAPFLMATALVVAGSVGAVDLGDTAAQVGLPRHLTVAAFLVPWFLVITSVVATWLIPVGLWQVVTWTRASRGQIGIPVAMAGDRWPWLLAALLTLKIGWLGLGYLGLLPSTLLGGSPAWRTAIDDGPVAWVIAAALALAAGWWLASRRRAAISELGFSPAAALVVIGFSLVSVLMSLVLLALPISQLLPGTARPAGVSITDVCASAWPSGAVGNAVTCVLDAILDRSATLTLLVDLATILVAFVLVIVWRDRRGRRSMVVFLAAVVVWVAPRVPDVVGSLLGRDFGPSIAPELTTLDTVLTLVVAALAVGWYAGRQNGAGPRSLVLVLVVASLITLPADSPEGTTSPLVVLALLFPIAYELTLDSERLNRPHPGRPAAVLASLGTRVGVLSLLALGVVLGDASLVGGAFDRLGKVLFAVPFAALVVAATLSRRAFASAVGPLGESGSRADTRVLARGAAGAVVVLALVVGAAGLVAVATTGSWVAAAHASPTATPLPTPAPPARLAEFLAHQQANQAVLPGLLQQIAADATTSGGAKAAVDSADLSAFVAGERGWLADHPPAGCYAAATTAWEAELDLFDEIALRLGGLTASSTQADVDAAFEPAANLAATDAAFLDALDASTCIEASPSPS